MILPPPKSDSNKPQHLHIISREIGAQFAVSLYKYLNDLYLIQRSYDWASVNNLHLAFLDEILTFNLNKYFTLVFML